MIERLSDKSLLEQSFRAVLMDKIDCKDANLGKALLAINVKRPEIKQLKTHKRENLVVDLTKIRKPRKNSSFDQALEMIGSSEEAVGFINLDALTQAQVCQTLAAKIHQRATLDRARKAARTIKQRYGEDFYKNIAKKGVEKRAQRQASQHAQIPVEMVTETSESLVALEAKEMPVKLEELSVQPTEKGARRFWSEIKETVSGIGRVGRLIFSRQGGPIKVGHLIFLSALAAGGISVAPNIEKLVLVRDHISGGYYHDGYYGYGSYNGYSPYGLPPTVTETQIATSVPTKTPAPAAEPVRTAPVVSVASPLPSPKAPEGQPTRPVQTPEATPQLARAESVSPLQPAEAPVPAVERPSEVIDEVTQRRAGIVGSYLELIQEIADQGITEAAAVLGKDLDSINPSVKEAARLRDLFIVEELANKTSADTDPLAFDIVVNNPQFQEELKKLSYNEVVSYETAGLPEYDLPEPTSMEQFIAQIAHLVRRQRTVGLILRATFQLFTQDPQRAPDLLKIAAIIGEREEVVDVSQIPHILAYYYNNPVGGEPVLRAIIGNKLYGTANFTSNLDIIDHLGDGLRHAAISLFREGHNREDLFYLTDKLAAAEEIADHSEKAQALVKMLGAFNTIVNDLKLPIDDLTAEERKQLLDGVFKSVLGHYQLAALRVDLPNQRQIVLSRLRFA